MRLSKNKSGFTLLEVIIVIIIVGVLASLALPRFFSTVEFSKATEALQSLAVTRQSIERCYLLTQDYSDCNTYADLDVEDPANSPNAHFSYGIAAGASTYTITATRTSFDGGNAGDTVVLTFDGTDITRSGSGAFSGIQ